MKLFNYSLLLGLLFTKCFGMGTPNTETFAHPNPLVTAILEQLKTKTATQTLQPKEFWEMMKKSTDMGSCFFGEFIGNAEEKDLRMVIEYLIKFGKTDIYDFYECIIECTGCDGITPLNELIRRIKSEDSYIYKLFLQLLDLIANLDSIQITDILNQKDLYGTNPIITAQRENKFYIANAITRIFFSDTGAAQCDYECSFDGTQIQRTKSQP